MLNSLLDLVVKAYPDGGTVDIDFDPFSYTSQADALSNLNIDIINPEALSEISTFDRTPQDLAISGHKLRQDALADSLATSQRKGSENLYGMTTAVADNPATSGFFGGPTLIQRGKNLINKILPGEPMSKIQTPPLGNTPMPQLTQNTPQKNAFTNLTRSEEALLSPTEKVIASRTWRKTHYKK